MLSSAAVKRVYFRDRIDFSSCLISYLPTFFLVSYHDADVVAQALRFLHAVGRENDGALSVGCCHSTDDIPHEASRYRVHPGRRLLTLRWRQRSRLRND